MRVPAMVRWPGKVPSGMITEQALTAHDWYKTFAALAGDPGERYNLWNSKLDMAWMFGIALQAVGEYEKSVAQYPNIKPGQEFTGYPSKSGS